MDVRSVVMDVRQGWSDGKYSFCKFQIGLRRDSGFASIYDEAGLELENLEMLFTHEGMWEGGGEGVVC